MYTNTHWLQNFEKMGKSEKFSKLVLLKKRDQIF